MRKKELSSTIRLGLDNCMMCYDVESHNIELGFVYHDFGDTLYLNFSKTNTNISVDFETWLYCTLEHEILHKVLHEKIGDLEGHNLDNKVKDTTIELMRTLQALGEM